MRENKLWDPSDDERDVTDLPMEAMPRVVFDTMGILPTLLVGIISADDSEGNPIPLDDNDNLFNDEKRFTELMSVVKSASITTAGTNHWISLLYIPMGDRTVSLCSLTFSSLSSLGY
jgi:hypothetical protein